MINSHTRSIVKAISWRITATIITVTLVFGFTGNLTLTVEIGSLEIVLKVVMYYLHERVWNKIK